MKTLIFEGTVTALTSISHIGETRGINSMLRREKIVGADHEVEEIPIISGNSVRGMLRDRGMLHMCRALGYGVNDETGEVLAEYDLDEDYSDKTALQFGSLYRRDGEWRFQAVGAGFKLNLATFIRKLGGTV